MVKKIKKLLISITLIIALVFINLASNIAGALSITSITPSQGPIAGGQEVRIEGEFEEKWEGDLKQISVGRYLSCVLDNENRIYCWGIAYANGSTSNSSVPVAIDMTGALNGKEVVRVSAGEEHACALDSGGKAYCWGFGRNNKLGDGSTGGLVSQPVEVVTTGALSGKVLIDIDANENHTCAIDSEGRAYCWGFNSDGQLGDWSTISRSTPVAVNIAGVLSGKKLVKIETGSYHTCALDDGGKAYCWGWGVNGQLGNGLTSSYSYPVGVNMTGVLNNKFLSQISLGFRNTCALSLDGYAYCWGDGSNGGLGSGSTASSSFPVMVDMSGVLSGKNVQQIDAGSGYALVMDDEGQVYRWGGDSMTNSSTPVVVDLGGIMMEEISAGVYHNCAIGKDRQAYCWGFTASQGLLGNNQINSQSVLPARVHTVSDGTGSALPDPHKLDFTVTMDADGVPAECVNVVIAADGNSLTCTTTAHVAGIVDITINDGVDIITLVDGYEYVTPAPMKAIATNGNIHWVGEEHDKEFVVAKDYTDESEVTVYWNGELLGSDKYTLSHGSTIVTLKSSYLNTLGVGSYNIKIAFDDGTIATGELLIKDKVIVPNTGTTTAEKIAAASGILVLLGIFVTIIILGGARSRKKNQ